MCEILLVKKGPQGLWQFNPAASYTSWFALYFRKPDAHPSRASGFLSSITPMTVKILSNNDLDAILQLGEALAPTVQQIRALEASIAQYDQTIEQQTALRDQAKQQLADAKKYLKTFVHIEEPAPEPKKTTTKKATVTKK